MELRGTKYLPCRPRLARAVSFVGGDRRSGKVPITNWLRFSAATPVVPGRDGLASGAPPEPPSGSGGFIAGGTVLRNVILLEAPDALMRSTVQPKDYNNWADCYK